MRPVIVGLLLNILLFFPLVSEAKKVIEVKLSYDDMALVIRKAIEASNDKVIKMVFQRRTYRFLPNYANDKYCIITNHGNGIKKTIFNFKGLNSIEIKGNGSELIFHGQLLPFLFEGLGNENVNKLNLDWDIPSTLLGEVMPFNAEEGWRDILHLTKGFP